MKIKKIYGILSSYKQLSSVLILKRQALPKEKQNRGYFSVTPTLLRPFFDQSYDYHHFVKSLLLLQINKPLLSYWFPRMHLILAGAIMYTDALEWVSIFPAPKITDQKDISSVYLGEL